MTTDVVIDETYAGHTDDQLRGLLQDAVADRIPLDVLVARARELRHAGEAAGDRVEQHQAGFGFGVQYQSDWRDYVEWDDRDDWEAGPYGTDVPLRFTTADAARVWCAVSEEQEHRVRHRNWQARHDRWLARKDLYDRRVQALRDAGLWTQDGEGVTPLLCPAGPGREPRRGVGATKYRVVPDAEMGTPVVEYALPEK